MIYISEDKIIWFLEEETEFFREITKKYPDDWGRRRDETNTHIILKTWEGAAAVTSKHHRASFRSLKMKVSYDHRHRVTLFIVLPKCSLYKVWRVCARQIDGKKVFELLFKVKKKELMLFPPIS